MDDLWWKILLKLMIWRYPPICWKPPYLVKCFSKHPNMLGKSMGIDGNRTWKNPESPQAVVNLAPSKQQMLVIQRRKKNLSVTNRFWSSFGLPNLELYQCVTFALATVVFASGVYPVSDTRKYHIVYYRISRLYLIMPVKWCVCLSRLYANLPDYGMCGIPIISLYLLLKSLCFLVQPPIYLNIISEVTLSQFCTHIS